MISVTKRDGRIEPLDINKIQRYTKDAVLGLKNVSQSELEVSAQIHFINGISTKSIQRTLIKTAADKISLDAPDWTFVAARLFLYDMYHRVRRNVNIPKQEKHIDYFHLKDYIAHGQKCGKIVEGLEDGYDLDLLDSKIDPKRDLQFNFLGIRSLHDRYLLKDSSGDLIELPQHMFMGIAMFLARSEKDKNFWAIKFYELISKFEVMCATPTLSNARTPHHQLSSCYIGSTPDNIEGIFESYKEMALLSKYGGGIGWDFSRIRGLNSYIDNHKNAAGGVIPFLRITNDIAIAVDQLGTRKGAIAAYLEVWHSDVMEFCELRKNSGEERRRAHDLFPALWICDLFMKRVEADGDWCLFDSYEVGDLTDLYGEEFEKRYEEYERDPSIKKQVLKAKSVWKQILTNYFETGLPFLCFKDTANRRNPNSHAGVIRSSNLCTEIFQNTSPNHTLVQVEFEDGSVKVLHESDVVNGIKAQKLTSRHFIDGKKVRFVSKVCKDGEIAVCNLASVNLSRVNTKEDIARVVPIAIRMLDNVIDLNYYPVKNALETNSKSRSIGLGVMGEAEMLASKQVFFGSDEHISLIDEIMEEISYHAIDTSANLAREKGAYPLFNGSKWSQGILPIHTYHDYKKLNLESRWSTLAQKVKGGVRNGYMLAIAPTASISLVVGTTQTIEPIYKRSWTEINLSGNITCVVPNLNADTFKYYVSAYDLDQLDIIKVGAVRQKWLDQGQSLNIFVKLDGVGLKKISEIFLSAWREGIKSTYYLRTLSPEASEELNINNMIVCEGCQ